MMVRSDGRKVFDYTGNASSNNDMLLTTCLSILSSYFSDIQLCQWLRNDQGKLKLGDFNRARVLAWNDEKQEYCTYSTGKCYGNVSSMAVAGIHQWFLLFCFDPKPPLTKPFSTDPLRSMLYKN